MAFIAGRFLLGVLIGGRRDTNIASLWKDFTRQANSSTILKPGWIPNRMNEMKLTLRQQSYWRKNLCLIGLLLGVWFLLSFVLLYFAREMTFSFFGWPFSFWLAGQGAPVAYCIIIAVYAGCMRRLDVEHDVAEGQE